MQQHLDEQRRKQRELAGRFMGQPTPGENLQRLGERPRPIGVTAVPTLRKLPPEVERSVDLDEKRRKLGISTPPGIDSSMTLKRINDLTEEWINASSAPVKQGALGVARKLAPRVKHRPLGVARKLASRFSEWQASRPREKVFGKEVPTWLGFGGVPASDFVTLPRRIEQGMRVSQLPSAEKALALQKLIWGEAPGKEAVEGLGPLEGLHPTKIEEAFAQTKLPWGWMGAIELLDPVTKFTKLSKLSKLSGPEGMAVYKFLKDRPGLLPAIKKGRAAEKEATRLAAMPHPMMPGLGTSLADPTGPAGAVPGRGIRLGEELAESAEEMSRAQAGRPMPRMGRAAPPEQALEAPSPAIKQMNPTVAPERVQEVSLWPRPSSTPIDILGLQNPEVGLSRRNEIANIARRTMGFLPWVTPDDAIVTKIMNERDRLAEVANSGSMDVTLRIIHKINKAFQLPGTTGSGQAAPDVASAVASTGPVRWAPTSIEKSSAKVPAFSKNLINDQGGVPHLAGIDPTVPGAPTISDIAARFPRYAPHLTPEQYAALDHARIALKPYGQVARSIAEKEFGYRPDVMKGGFYIPRSGGGEKLADALDNLDMPRVLRPITPRLKPLRRIFRRVERKLPSEKPARFPSEAKGIALGYKYGPLSEAIATYTRGIGGKLADKHIATLFKSMRDPDTRGLLASTAADRADPIMRAKINRLRNKITNRIQTLRNQEARTNAEKVALKRIRDFSDRADRQKMKVAERLAARVEKGDVSDVLFPLMERDLVTLERIGQMLETGVGKAGKTLSGTIARKKATRDEIVDLRVRFNDLQGKWAAELDRAGKIPTDEASIGLPGLGGLSFPIKYANAAQKVIDKESKAVGYTEETFRMFNSFYRGMTSTLDNSAPGIQGLLAFYSNPRAALGALRVNHKAWGRGGDDVLGAYFEQFNEQAAQSGRLSVAEWVREGMHIGGMQTEFRVTQLEKVPGLGRPVRMANRAFGYQGDSLRPKLADDLLSEELSRGRSLKEIRDSGDMRRIADIANKMTGWSPGRTFSNVGDLILYAPRFLQSRLEVTAKGLRGLLPGARIDERVARRSLVKMIAFGTIMTVSANEALGEETDFRPIVDGKYNSKFMKIKYKGRRYSLFGTWDSLARAIVGVGTGQLKDVLRSMGSGTVTIAWDGFSKQDFMGRRLTDSPEQFGIYLMRQFSPFAMEEIPSAVIQGATGDVSGSAVTIVGEVYGLKSFPLSKEAEARTAFIRALGLKTMDGELVNEFHEVNRVTQRELLRKYPKLREWDTKMQAERNKRSNDAELASMEQEIVARQLFYTEMNDNLDQLKGSRKLYDSGRKSIRDRYSGKREAIWGNREALETDSVQAIAKWIERNQLPEDAATDAYWLRLDDLIEETGLLDKRAWDRINQNMSYWLRQEYGPEIAKYVLGHRDDWIKDLPEPVRSLELKRATMIRTGEWWHGYNQPARPGFVPSKGPGGDPRFFTIEEILGAPAHPDAPPQPRK